MKAYLWFILRKTISALRERWDLTLENVALKHLPQSVELPCHSEWRIAVEPISCQSKLRLRHQTTIAPVSVADRGPPCSKPSKPLLKESSPSMRADAVSCPITIRYGTRVRCRKTSEAIYQRCQPSDSESKGRQVLRMYRFQCRSDPLAA